MPNARVRRIAYDFENEAKTVMEKLYPGYVLQKCQVRYSDIVHDEADLFDLKHDLQDIFADTGDRAEFMVHILDAH